MDSRAPRRWWVHFSGGLSRFWLATNLRNAKSLGLTSISSRGQSIVPSLEYCTTAFMYCLHSLARQL